MFFDQVEFYLNTLPADILKGELDRSLGIGEEESLVEYMMRGDPNIVNALKALDASNKKTEKGVTVSDGNSFFHITKEEFLRNLPRKILNVPNPTFRVSIIGRKQIKQVSEILFNMTISKHSVKGVLLDI